MKKRILILAVLLYTSICIFGDDNPISTKHSYYSDCAAYKDKSALIYYKGYADTLENAKKTINDFYNKMVSEGGCLVNYVEKPYRNEPDSAYKLILQYYDVSKGDIYLVNTFVGFLSNRLVYIWIGENESYNYWVYEYELKLK